MPQQTIYTVKPGDTLGGIAQRFGTTSEALARLNGITDASKIRIGQVLQLGSPKPAAPQPTPPPPAPVPASSLPRIYTIVSGDSLSAIAEKFGVSSADIRALNGIANADRIVVGQMLKIPVVRPAAPIVPASVTKPATPKPPVATPSASPVTPHELGKLSAKFESSGRGPGTVSSGDGDPGGVSYGTYQLASKVGTLQKFLEQEGQAWAAKFAGLTGGTQPFSDVWKEIAAAEPAKFQSVQHSFIERTHYLVQVDTVKAETGKDLKKCGTTIQDVVWSVSVQHGGTTLLITRAMANVTIPFDTAGYDKALINAVYDERTRMKGDVLAYFTKAPPDWQEGLKKRFATERADALAMLAKEVPVASTPAPKPVVAPATGGPVAFIGPDRTIDTQLPLSGPGFVTYNPDDAAGTDRYGKAAFVQKLVSLSAAWAQQSPVPVSWGDMSKPGGGPFAPHVGHQQGDEADVRPFSKDGTNKRMTWQEADYDQERTRAFLKLLRQRHANAIIFFNDPVLIAEGLTTKLAGHDNHLHIKLP